MRKLFFILFSLGVFSFSSAQHWEALKRIGGMQKEESGNIMVDNAGDVCVTGIFSGETYFGDDTLYSVGLNDIFVAKYDKFNTLLWVKQIHGPAANNILYSRIIGFDIANSV